MIDPESERLYVFNQARRWLPRRRRGKRPSLQTMYRWSNEGYHGIVLETLQVGSSRCTSREAVARFIQRISDLPHRSESESARNRPRTARQVDKALEEAGFDRRPSRHVKGVSGGKPTSEHIGMSGSPAAAAETSDGGNR